MKLYTTDGSPFGARVKIQIYKKNLPVEILAPPGGMGSAELKSLSPSAKIPVLALEDSIIIESEIIQEYLEDKFPKPSLRGDTAETTAHIRMLSRITDLYLVPALQPFRSYLKGENENRANLHEGVENLQPIFTMYEYFMTGNDFAVAEKLSLADCAMAPLFYYLRYFSKAVDVDLSLTDFPRLTNWETSIKKDKAVDRVLQEIDATR
jgi:glutathione S-transferase